jgi:DNA-binding PadR family transcriptional regulator
MLDLAILGLLKEQELHGYELKKRLADRLGPLSSVSFGSLYPALARLESAGAVKAIEARDRPGPSIPMTGSLGGELAAFRARRVGTRGSRGKKVYGITEHGEQLFEELLITEAQSGADDDRAFNLKLAFARYLPRPARIGMLERRRALLADRVTHATDSVQSTARLDTYARTLLEHRTEMTQQDISWLDRLIAAERKDSSK